MVLEKHPHHGLHQVIQHCCRHTSIPCLLCFVHLAALALKRLDIPMLLKEHYPIRGSLTFLRFRVLGFHSASEDLAESL